MKKNNAGYALPFVLVVMTVLCLVATSAMTASLRNLQSQQALIKRMENQYAAEGKIEKIVAQLTDTSTMGALSGTDKKNAIEKKIQDICGTETTVTFDATDVSTTDGTFACSFTIETSSGTIIKCKLKLEGTITERTDETGGTTTFEVTSPKITYTSYEIGGAA